MGGEPVSRIPKARFRIPPPLSQYATQATTLSAPEELSMVSRVSRMADLSAHCGHTPTGGLEGQQVTGMHHFSGATLADPAHRAHSIKCCQRLIG